MQAVLTHTYILRRQLTEQANPDKNLKGADISDDSSLSKAISQKISQKNSTVMTMKNAYKKAASAVKAVIRSSHMTANR